MYLGAADRNSDTEKPFFEFILEANLVIIRYYFAIKDDCRIQTYLLEIYKKDTIEMATI